MDKARHQNSKRLSNVTLFMAKFFSCFSRQFAMNDRKMCNFKNEQTMPEAKKFLT